MDDNNLDNRWRLRDLPLIAWMNLTEWWDDLWPEPTPEDTATTPESETEPAPEPEPSNSLLPIAIILFSIVFCSGCATLTNDPTVPIQIYASESDTQVKANGHWYNTPAVVSFQRGQGDQPLVFRREGQNDTTVFLKEDADSAEWGNAFWPVLGLIFMAVDYSNGKGYTLKPETVHFSFHAPTGIFDPTKNSAPIPEKTAFDSP